MIDPKNVCLFVPPELRKFKLNLFNRIGSFITARGGQVVRGDHGLLDKLPAHIYPIIGCSSQLAPLRKKWLETNRQWIGWDRGYLRRVFATWLPKAESLETSYYRWHVNGYQLARLRDVPDDRWRALRLQDQVKPWRKNGRRIVIADTLPDYWLVRGLPVDWSQQMHERLKQQTDRPIFVRHKESKLPLSAELQDAHCLVTHGSIAAVEAAIMGCPVFVDQESAASHVGVVGFDDIEHPVYPERQLWLNSLAYSNFSEREMLDGTVWKLMDDGSG
jgi:hypothetical protein